MSLRRLAQRRIKGKVGQIQQGWFKVPPEQLENLEALFSIFEYYELENNMHGAFFDDIRRVLHVLLRRHADLMCRLDSGQSPFGVFADDEPYSPYHRFVEGRLLPRTSGERAIVISLNYDLVLEMAIWRLGENPDYRVRGAEGWLEAPGSGVPILKLHGSINWKQRGDDIVLVGGSDVVECPANDTGDPSWLMLPPTTQKNVFTNTLLLPVWTEALAALREMDELVVIGYSFPVTDPYFRNFLTAGLAQNSRAFVVSTYLRGDDEARQRISDFMRTGGVEDGRVTHYPIGFFDAVNQGLL